MQLKILFVGGVTEQRTETQNFLVRNVLRYTYHFPLSFWYAKQKAVPLLFFFPPFLPVKCLY